MDDLIYQVYNDLRESGCIKAPAIENLVGVLHDPSLAPGRDAAFLKTTRHPDANGLWWLDQGGGRISEPNDRLKTLYVSAASKLQRHPGEGSPWKIALKNDFITFRFWRPKGTARFGFAASVLR